MSAVASIGEHADMNVAPTIDPAGRPWGSRANLRNRGSRLSATSAIKERDMKRYMLRALFAATLLPPPGTAVHASSHREALAILNEPCADNTDTYAWVSPGSHEKLYLIMNFNPLHEPGQGNQGLRA